MRVHRGYLIVLLIGVASATDPPAARADIVTLRGGDAVDAFPTGDWSKVVQGGLGLDGTHIV